MEHIEKHDSTFENVTHDFTKGNVLHEDARVPTRRASFPFCAPDLPQMPQLESVPEQWQGIYGSVLFPPKSDSAECDSTVSSACNAQSFHGQRYMHPAFCNGINTFQGFFVDEESSIQAADSNSPKQPFVPCKVCGDRASGYHYGVTSCEGCKGFFRRSIQKQIEYRCLRDGKCMVIRLNRNRCQYCRFKKCLAVGMSRDSVRFGRVPKRSKSMDEQHVSSTEPTLEQTALESKQLAIYDIILNVSQAHLANCGVTDDKLKLLQRRHATLMTKIEIPDTLVQFSDEELETQRLLMWQCYAHLTTPAIQSMVEFVKRIPGILELSQDDQLILIKMSFFEMWVTRMARMFSPDENCLTFEDGSMIQKEELSVVYTAEFVNAMFDVAGNINGLNLNDTEIGLLSAVILATPDRHGIRDMKAVENLWEKLIEALKLQLKRNHSTEENLFGTALVKLSELRTLGSHHNELLQYYRSHWHRCKIPPLFSEIYDVPKNEVYTGDSAASL